jgi:hypothetical protein
MWSHKGEKMRKLKIICIWVIVSFALQTGILFYLSNYYFTDKTEVTFKTINEVTQGNINNIKLPQEAEKIKISSSGRYAMYYLDKILHVINLIDGKDNVVDLDVNSENNFVKWYEVEDKLIISEKKTVDGENGIKIYIYQAKDNLKQEALDFNNKSKIYELPKKNAKVADIQLNTLNTILYIESSDNNINYISRLDISDVMYKVPINTKTIGDYFIIKQQDEVVFEDSLSKKVYIFNSSKIEEILIDGVDKSKLLYVDNEGSVYIGHLENDKVKSIYYKNCIEKDNSKWEKVELKNPLELNDIHIFNQGGIYAVDNKKAIVTNLKNDRETKFTGTFVDMNFNSILSLKEQKVVLSNLK